MNTKNATELGVGQANAESGREAAAFPQAYREAGAATTDARDQSARLGKTTRTQLKRKHSYHILSYNNMFYL